jgi:chloramphenicol 3-O-phosphotransferase
VSEPGPPLGRLIVVTGAQAAGKTTVGYAVAARLPRAIHVDGDSIHRMVVSGVVPMTLPAPPAAVEQLFLRWLGSIAVAETYQRAGFDAVLSDNIFGDFLEDFLDFVSPAPVHLVVLNPSVEILREREAGRDKSGYDAAVTAEALWRSVNHDTRRVGLWLDTSRQNVIQTANAVLDRLDEAFIG